MENIVIDNRQQNISAADNRKANFSRCSRVSDLKRTNSLLRRIKDFKPESQDAILSEVKTLNLTRYVSESCAAIVSTILDGKVRINDVEFFGTVCSEIHQCYDNFERETLTFIKKKWDIQEAVEASEETKESARNRVMIRFICELYRVGITSEWRIFRWILQQSSAICPDVAKLIGGHVTEAECTKSTERLCVILGYTNVFVRSVGGCLFQANRWPDDSCESLTNSITEPFVYNFTAPSLASDEICKLLVTFIDIGLSTLEYQNSLLKQIWAKNLKAIKNIGDLPESLREQFGDKKKVCDKLFSLLYPLVVTFPGQKKALSSKNLKLDKVPSLETLYQESEKSMAFNDRSSSLVFLSGLSSFYSVDQTENEINAYDSLAEQQFYDSINSVPLGIEESLKQFEESNGCFDCTEEEASRNIDSHLHELAIIFRGASSADPMDDRYLQVSVLASQWTEKFLSERLALLKYRTRGDRDQGRSFLLSAKKKFSRYLRDTLIDDPTSVVGISYILVLLYQTGHPDLMDISERLSKEFEESLVDDLTVKPFTNEIIPSISSKCAFLCQGMKFRFVSPGSVLRILSILTDHQILKHQKLLAAALFDCLSICGGFLARHPIAQHKFESVLQTASKSIRSLGGEIEIQLGSIISECLQILSAEQARENTQSMSFVKRKVKQKVRSYEERYLRHLIYSVLKESNVRLVVDKLLLIDLESFEMRLVAFDVLRKSHHVSFQNIPFLAQVVRALSENGMDYISNYIVDDIIERCRQDLEANCQSGRSSQKKLSDMFYFVELFNVGIVHESTLFYVLYMICLHDLTHESSYEYSRIRLIITILQSFQYTVPAGKGKQSTTLHRLRVFLHHFYVLIHAKDQPFPIDLNFSLGDAFDRLKRLYSTASLPLEGFPESQLLAQQTLESALLKHGMKKENIKQPDTLNTDHRMESKDPVNFYRFFFENSSASNEVHMIHDGNFGGIEDKDHQEDEIPTEDKETGYNETIDEEVLDNQPHHTHDNEPSVEVLSEEALYDKNYPQTTTALEEQCENTADALEFDKLLKDMTKESFSAIRQQHSLKAMSGRRVVGGQSVYMSNLRRMTQNEIPSHSIGVIDEDKRTVSVAVAVRSKVRPGGEQSASGQAERKGKNQSKIDFRVIQIPHDTTMAIQQSANIEEKRRERDEIRRATQSIVSAMERDQHER